MSIKNISLGMAAVVVAVAGLAIEASAGPICPSKGGARAKVAAAQPAKQVLASKPAPKAAPVVAQAPAAAPAPVAAVQAPVAEKPANEKKVSDAKVEAPVVEQQAAATVAEPDYTSVSAIAARLAALNGGRGK